MFQLSDPGMVTGKHQEAIRKLFGEIRVASALHYDNIELRLRADLVLPNLYRDAYATVEKSPLYVLTPNIEVGCVWPGKVGDEVRHGISFDPAKQERLSTAIAVFSDVIGLYICLRAEKEFDPTKLQINYLGI